MANTYTLIASNTLSTTAASVTFSSIAATYTDLLLKYSARDNQPGATANDNTLQFNGSASNFTGKRLLGSGSAASSSTLTNYPGSSTSAGSTVSTFCNNEIYIPNYTSANYKSYSVDSVTENNATEAYQIIFAGLWSNTAAINSISIVAPATYPFVQYSTFYLYGIKNS